MTRASVAQSRQERRTECVWRTQGVGVLTLALLLLGLGGVAVAQTPQSPNLLCSAVPACGERLVDLQAYREYLEDTVATCKAANKSLSATLNAKQQELEALTKTRAPAAEPTKP